MALGHGWTNEPVSGSLRDLQSLSLVLVNGTDDEEVWNHMIRTWHYLGFFVEIKVG